MSGTPAGAPSPSSPAASSSSTSLSSLPSVVSSRALLDWFIAHTSPSVRSLLAGGCAGCVAKTATAPLDRVKILYQGSNPLLHRFTASWAGPFQAVLWIWREEGWRGCYKGHAATLLRIFPYAALNYFCYDKYKRAILHWARLHHVEGTGQQAAVSVLAGGLAGSTSVAFTYPLDYVHSRITYQVRISRYRGIVQTIRSTLQEGVEQAKVERLMRSLGETEASAAAGSQQAAVKGVTLPLPHLLYGIRKLYTGFGTTIMGIIPYAGVSFATYDTLKRLTTQLSAAQQRQQRRSLPQHVPQPHSPAGLVLLSAILIRSLPSSFVCCGEPALEQRRRPHPTLSVSCSGHLTGAQRLQRCRACADIAGC